MTNYIGGLAWAKSLRQPNQRMDEANQRAEIKV
jgi:hypothetical protein